MKYRNALAVSSLLHAILFLPSVLGGTQSEGDKPGGGPTPPKSQTVNVRIIEKTRVSGARHADCPDSFGGIGMSTDGDRIVLKVYNGYPAARHGIKVGDKVLTPLNDIRGKPGTTIQVVIIRDGKMKGFKIVRETICARDEG